MKFISAVHHNLVIWRIFGAWPPENLSTCKYLIYQTYFLIIFTFCTFLYILAKIVKVLFYIDNLTELAESLFILITEISYLPKLANVIYKRQRIKNLLNQLECEIFQPVDTEGTEIINRTINMINKTTYFYRCIAVFTASSACMVPVLDGTSIDYNLPYKTWYPWKTDYDPMYSILYFHQSFSMMMHCLMILTTDSFSFALMALAGGQFDLLSHYLSRVADESNPQDPERKVELSVQQPTYRFTEETLRKKIIKCIHHHRTITEFIQEIESVFSFSIFVQIFLSGIILCITGLQLSLLSPSQEPMMFFMTFSYQITMLCEIFCPCWFGNELILKSSNLGLATYKSDWVERLTRENQPNFQILKIFIERVKRPTKVIAGGLLELSMATFTSILNSAYSYYAVLQRMNSNS